MTPGSATSSEEVKIAVPQRYKDYVVQRQYRSFWFIVIGVTSGVNAIYYFSCLAFHWKWRLHFSADMVPIMVGLINYMLAARKPWHYLINDRLIKLFLVHPKIQIANLKELEWAKAEVVGVEYGEWRGFPCLKLRILPISSYIYMMVWSEPLA